jgi:hypothetical protein
MKEALMVASAKLSVLSHRIQIFHVTVKVFLPSGDATLLQISCLLF